MYRLGDHEIRGDIAAFVHRTQITYHQKPLHGQLAGVSTDDWQIVVFEAIIRLYSNINYQTIDAAGSSTCP